MKKPSPWERQPGEPAKPWAAFDAYRDMHPGVRSAVRVAEQCGKSERLLNRWSATWDWVRRAAAWDAERDRVARIAELEAIAKAKRDEIEMVAKMRQRHMETAIGLQAMGRGELRKWMLRLERAGADAEPVLTPRELRQLIEAGVKLERLTRGEPDTIQEQQDPAAAAERRALMRPLLANPEAASAIAKLNELALKKEDEE